MENWDMRKKERRQLVFLDMVSKEDKERNEEKRCGVGAKEKRSGRVDRIPTLM